MRRRSPAKDHRTGHYATNGRSGSNGNSHKAQGIVGFKKIRTLRLAQASLTLSRPDDVPVLHRGCMWRRKLASLLHHWLGSLA